MADLSKIKEGDKLRFTGEVSTVTKSGVAVHIEGAATHSTWIIPFSGSTLEAAEHIPAPRIFKRGDWVKHTEEISCGAVDIGDCCGHCESTRVKRHGLVCNQVANRVAVFWLDTGMETLDSDELEPDEAPE